MSLISLETINGTPVFVAQSTDPNYERVHGNILDRDNKRYLFPAYPPFGLLAANDLKRAFPATSFSPEAAEQLSHLQSIPKFLADRKLPDGFTFKTKPFDHQIEALAQLNLFPRFALYYDAGTGKSKIIVDLKRCFPNQRMLILTPKVTVQNWVREVQTHSGGTLRAIALRGTPEQKREMVSRYKEYDVIVSSYGTARNLGHPRLHKETLKAIQDASANGAHLTEHGLSSLTKGIRVLSDPERQQAMVLAWALGTPISSVTKFAAAEGATTAQWLCDIDYGIIVSDESQNLNNNRSQQTKAAVALSKKAGRRYLLSGTPTLGDPRHLYAQMKFLSPAIIPEDWFKFSDMFLIQAPWNKHIVTGFKNMDIINQRVNRVSIRKTKDECLDLPPRSIIDVSVEPSSEQRKLYNTLVSEMSVELGTFFSNESKLAVQNAAVLLNKLAQVTSGFLLDSGKRTDVCDNCPQLVRCVDSNVQPYTAKCSVVQKPPPGKLNLLKENPKLDALEGLLDDILANESSKVIVWGSYYAELDCIAELLKKKELPFVRVDGETGGAVQKRIDTFNTVPTCRVYLGQVATGVGITLNAAAYMVYFSLPWSLGTYLQSIDRNYRVGQTKKTFAYRLIQEGTVDRFKATALSEKKDLNAVLTNKLACAICEHQARCLRNNVELFDEDCQYHRSVQRTIARARPI